MNGDLRVILNWVQGHHGSQRADGASGRHYSVHHGGDGSYRVLVQGSGFHLIWPSSDGGFTFSLDHPLGLDECKVWAQQYEDEAAAPLYSVW